MALKEHDTPLQAIVVRAVVRVTKTTIASVDDLTSSAANCSLNSSKTQYSKLNTLRKQVSLISF